MSPSTESVSAPARTQVSPWQVGLVVGTAAAALSLRPSGLQRGPLAQSLLAGASFALGMGDGIGLNKGVKAVAEATDTSENTVRGIAMGIGAAALLAGRVGKSHPFPFSNTVDSVGRTTVAIAAGGFAVDPHNRVADEIEGSTDGVPHEVISTAMAGVEATALIGYLAWRRKVNVATDVTTPSFKALMAATGTITGATLAVGTAQTLTNDSNKRLRDHPWVGRAGLAAAGVGVAGIAALAFKKFHGRVLTPPPVLTTPFETVAGKAGSLIDLNQLSPAAVTYLDTAVPAAKISEVMGEPAIDPIRVIVGLKSAPTPATRADLGLRELDRLGAFGRKGRKPVDYIFVTVPPGAGKIDPPLMSSAEYMSRGSVASIALQYSDRPSALSLNRVDSGAETYRHLFEGLRERITAMPEGERPKVLVYGNSLGAWVSQETAGGLGVAGMPAIDRALWVGTPGPSGWYRQMMYSTDPAFAADRAMVKQFSTVDELREFSSTEAADSVRFYLHTRASDPVPKIDADMIWRKPLWLRDNYKELSGAPRHSVYTPGVTFLQELTDTAITATIADKPGMATVGHTYHTDIIPDVRHALFPGKVTDAQEQAIHGVLDGAPPINV